MTESTTLTVRLAAGVKDQLGELAELTHRSRSYLAGEAIGAFVEREMGIVAGVERGREDVRAGRVVDHGPAMAELDAAIEFGRDCEEVNPCGSYGPATPSMT